MCSLCCCGVGSQRIPVDLLLPVKVILSAFVFEESSRTRIAHVIAAGVDALASGASASRDSDLAAGRCCTRLDTLTLPTLAHACIADCADHPRAVAVSESPAPFCFCRPPCRCKPFRESGTSLPHKLSSQHGTLDGASAAAILRC